MKFSLSKLIKILAATIAVYLLIALTPVGGFVKNITAYIFGPIISITSTVTKSVTSFFGAFFQIGDLQKKNTKLQLEVADLEGQVASLQEAKKQNEELKAALDVKDQSNGKLIVSQVIGKDSGSFLQQIIIDKGSQDGVKNGAAVVYGGILVGKITELKSTMSTVTLIISPKSNVPALIQQTRSMGIVRGQVGYGLVLDEVPIEEKLTPGEQVISSGLGDEYPKGLVIGQIESVQSDQSNIFQSATLSLPLDFRKLETVFVKAD